MADEMQTLLTSLDDQREHVLGILDGLAPEALHRPVLPSGWTSLGLVQHLALDVERFWFWEVVAGAETVGARIRPVSLPRRGRCRPTSRRPACSISTDGRSSGPTRSSPSPRSRRHRGPGPTSSGDWRLDDLRAVVLHVITETACHAGHLDAARELLDETTWLTLT